MGLRPLIIDEVFKADCGYLRKFSEDPKNWYVLGEDLESSFIPGDNPEYILKTNFDYRVVLTITDAPTRKPFRHLTISVPGRAYPHPSAVFTIAHYLGFTGATVVEDVVSEPGPWGVVQDSDEGGIVVQQEYEIPKLN